MSGRKSIIMLNTRTYKPTIQQLKIFTNRFRGFDWYTTTFRVQIAKSEIIAIKNHLLSGDFLKLYI